MVSTKPGRGTATTSPKGARGTGGRTATARAIRGTTHTNAATNTARVVPLDTPALFAADIAAAFGALGREGESTAADTALGMRKGKDGKIEHIARFTPPRRVRGDMGSRLMRRAAVGHQLEIMLPPTVRDTHSALKAAHYGKAAPEALATAEQALIDALAHEGTRVAEMVRNGRPLSSLGASDLAVYYLASVYASMHREIEVLYALPTVKACLPETVYNTKNSAWQDFITGQRAALSAPMASKGGGIGAGVHPEREPITGPLKRWYQDWRIEESEMDFHAAAMGREGAPEWDLLDYTIQIAAAALLVTESKLIAFGEQPDLGVYTPGAFIVPGVLYLVTPVAVNYDQGNGELNYNALAAFIRTQHAAAQWSAGLKGDILTMGSDDYDRLSVQMVNSAAGSTSVLAALLQNVPGIREIRQAREYTPNTVELDRLTALGHPLASYYSGGVRAAGAQRAAITLHRDDPNVISVLTGEEMQTIDNGQHDGVYGGRMALSTGGTWLRQPGLAIGYQEP